MPDAITWSQIGVLIAALGLVIGLVKWVQGALQARDQSIVALTAAMNIRDQSIEKQINDFKVQVAQDYALNRTVDAAEKGMSDAVRGVYERIDAMTKRLDNLLTELIRERREKD